MLALESCNTTMLFPANQGSGKDQTVSALTFLPFSFSPTLLYFNQIYDIFLVYKSLATVIIFYPGPRDPGRPRWLSRMPVRLEIRGLRVRSPAGSVNILSWRLIMKYFLQSFSPFFWFKKGSCQFLTKECAQVLLNHLEDYFKPAQEKCG